MITQEYQELVLDDLKTYGELCHPVKAGLLERLLMKDVSVRKLHPNPEDEFCDPKIGPNYSIISRYEEEYLRPKKDESYIFRESLTVEKLTTGGYRILNGHHRWMAAARIKKRTLPVSIVNPVETEEIIQTVEASARNMCVSIDLDEVLLCDEKVPAEKLLFPLNCIFKKRIRRSVGVLISELQKKGFDVWVYSGAYHSVSAIKALFALRHVKVDGIINGSRGKKNQSAIRKAFREKYQLSIHVDNESVLWVNTRTKEYESIDLHPDKDWANDVFGVISGLNISGVSDASHENAD